MSKKLSFDKQEALNIPILEVAAIVMPSFVEKGKNSTGQCCKHTDNKLGNVSFQLDKNRVHCFTCSSHWNNISLVMDYLNLNFYDALCWLYEKFPTYFSNVEEFKIKEKWNGLENNEYKFLKINTSVYILDKNMHIREFANEFPEEHDYLLVSKALKIVNSISEYNTELMKRGFEENCLNLHLERINKKIKDLVTKGLMNKNNLELFVKKR